MDPIWVDPERMSGTPCFTGTRVPVDDLFDFLIRGHELSRFLEASPTVKQEQAIAVLELARAAVVPVSQPPASPRAPSPEAADAA